MKKIGLITLNGYFNYGNRLQNYGLETILNRLGYEVQTIRLNKNNRKYNIKLKMYNMKEFMLNHYNFRKKMKRKDIFKRFSKKYLRETRREFYINDDLSFLNNEYDKFIVGSDQVWNPNMNENSAVYFLQFASENKRISYAASFGITNFEKETRLNYSKWLSSIPNISVREKEGSQIVKNLADKNAKVLLDPVMLLSKEDWTALSSPAITKPKQQYLLTYFLGSIPEEYMVQIKKIATDNNLEIVNMGDTNSSHFYETGPSEFLDYIKDAKIFCTDSFHGVAFSILFEKPFIVYERKGSKSMYSRIRTIIDKFGLQSREYNNIKTTEDIFEVNYTKKDEILDYEINKSVKFLQKALSN